MAHERLVGVFKHSMNEQRCHCMICLSHGFSDLEAAPLWREGKCRQRMNLEEMKETLSKRVSSGVGDGDLLKGV